MPSATITPTSIDDLVDATPAARDRVVDLLRAVSIGVVVLWHWSLSITHWRAGALTMPNPVGDVPGLWAATWVLQVMPVFFFVGGYANLAGWEAVGRGGDGAAGRFLCSRMRRLVGPLIPWLGCWLVADLAWRAAGGRSVLAWGTVVFVPLWFLGVYAGVVLAVPVTARMHARWRWRVPAALVAAALTADVLRLGLDVGGAVVGLAGSACVWLFCHQLGYFWRDGTLSIQIDTCGAAVEVGGCRSVSMLAVGRRRAGALVAAGLGGLVVLTAVGPYPAAMVAVRGAGTSNMFPTTACIAALASFQLGVVLWLHPRLDALLRRRAAWRAVVAANGLAMPVFCWHMTALVAFLWLYERAGFTLAAEPTAGWWLTRPVWVVGPGLVLGAVLVGLRRTQRDLPPTRSAVRGGDR
ncbi:MAG TPA: acyltransferase family protein [Acidimicrobiales bacterium]|nr:acyltransferase family protein [Acidimicrobiales bacterium]